jgi:hypothetical protein
MKDDDESADSGGHQYQDDYGGIKQIRRRKIIIVGCHRSFALNPGNSLLAPKLRLVLTR